MIINILTILFLIISIIFAAGFIINLLYLIIIPANKLSTEDCLRKNILTKYSKIKNNLFVI